MFNDRFKTKTKEIDGINVSVQPLPAVQGLQTQLRIIKTIGPAVKGLEGVDLTNLDGQEINIGQIVGMLIDSLHEEKTLKLIRFLVGTAIIDNSNIDSDDAFNEHFTTNYMFLYKILGFVLEVNFGNFFGKGGIGNLLGKTNPSTAKSSKD